MRNNPIAGTLLYCDVQ